MELRPGTTGNRTVTLYDATDFTSPIEPGGASVQVSIGVPGQNARLTFTGVAGEQVSAVLSNVTVAETDVSILNPDGTPLGGSLFVNGSSGFIDARTLPADGTYTVSINPRHAHTGDATVTLYDATEATGTIAPDGTPVSVSTSSPGQNARLTFTAAEGGRVILKVSGSTYATGFTCGIAVSILDPAAAVLGSDGCVAQGEEWIDTVVAPVADTYSVFVNPFSTNTGGVTLTLYAVAADVTGTITDDTPITQALSMGQNARYAYNGAAGTRVSIHVPTSSISSCATLALLNPDATVLASRFVCPTGFQEPVTLPSAGTYTVLLDPSGPSAGTFTLVLYEVSPDVSGTIPPGTPLVVTIDDPGQNAALTFTASAGQLVDIIGSNSSLGCTNYKLLRPDGSQQAATFSCGTGFTFNDQTLGTAGTYTISIDPSGPGVGQVTIQVQP